MADVTDPMPPTSTHLWTKEYILLDIISFLFFTSFYLLTSTFQFFVLAHGATVGDLGFVLAVLTVTAVISRPVIGPLIDSLGRRKILLFGLALMTVANLLYLAGNTLWVIIFIRIVQGVGWSMSTTAASTMVNDIVAPDRRGEAMGFYSNFTDLAMAFGPFLGVYITRGTQYTWLFLVGAVCTLAALLFLTGVPERRNASVSPAAGEGRVKIRFQLESRAFLPSLVLLTITFSYASVLGYLPTFVRHAGLTHKFLGIQDYAYFYIFFALTLLFTRGPWGRVYDKRGKSLVIISGIILLVLAMVGLNLVRNLPEMLVFAVLFATGFGAVQPATLAWAVSRTPKARWGKAISTYYTAFDGGMALAYASLGYIIQLASYPAAFLTSAGILLGGLCCFAVMSSVERRKNPSESV